MARSGGHERRLRKRDRLDRRLAAGRLGRRKLRRVAEALARRHAEAPDGPELAKQGSPVRIARRAREAAAELEEVRAALGLPARAVAAIARRQHEALAERVDGFLDRHEQGRILAIHGDLRAVNVAVRGRTVRLRGGRARGGRDAAEDLARLCVDLAARGGSLPAELLLASYAERADDFGLYAVIDFYQRHQACRLAVERARAPSGPGPDARRYALAARASGRRPALPPTLIATGGPVASGKSTVARAIARHLAAPRVVADRVRDALLEGPRREAHEATWALSFAEDFSDRVYAGMLRRAEAVLASGRPVVLDACFPRRADRVRAAELASRHGVAFWFVECRPEPEAMRARLARRNARDGRDEAGWLELAGQLAQRSEPRAADEPGHHLPLRTDASLADCAARVVAALPTWPEGRADA